MGGQAERWTSAAFHRLARRGWEVIDDVAFDRCNVDHVVVGPGMVLAVETKWTATPLAFTPAAFTPAAFELSGSGGSGGSEAALAAGTRMLDQARRSARKARSLLRSGGVDVDALPVVAVLVVWGPGAPRLEGGYLLVGDVRVLAGTQAHAWRPRLLAASGAPTGSTAAGSAAGAEARKAAGAARAFVERRELAAARR